MRNADRLKASASLPMPAWARGSAFAGLVASLAGHYAQSQGYMLGWGSGWSRSRLAHAVELSQRLSDIGDAAGRYDRAQLLKRLRGYAADLDAQFGTHLVEGGIDTLANVIAGAKQVIGGSSSVDIAANYQFAATMIGRQDVGVDRIASVHKQLSKITGGFLSGLGASRFVASIARTVEGQKLLQTVFSDRTSDAEKKEAYGRLRDVAEAMVYTGATGDEAGRVLRDTGGLSHAIRREQLMLAYNLSPEVVQRMSRGLGQAFSSAGLSDAMGRQSTDFVLSALIAGRGTAGRWQISEARRFATISRNVAGMLRSDRGQHALAFVELASTLNPRSAAGRLAAKIRSGEADVSRLSSRVYIQALKRSGYVGTYGDIAQALNTREIAEAGFEAVSDPAKMEAAFYKGRQNELIGRLAREAGLRRRTVQRIVDEGFAVTGSRRHKSYVYRLISAASRVGQDLGIGDAKDVIASLTTKVDKPLADAAASTRRAFTGERMRVQGRMHPVDRLMDIFTKSKSPEDFVGKLVQFVTGATPMDRSTRKSKPSRGGAPTTGQAEEGWSGSVGASAPAASHAAAAGGSSIWKSAQAHGTFTIALPAGPASGTFNLTTGGKPGEGKEG